MADFKPLMKLEIDKIIDNGKESERVLIKVLEDCNLNNYILYDETFDEDGKPSNKVPHMYRFEKRSVKKGEFVSLYTKGEKGYTLSTMKTPKGAPLHRIKRGLDINIFNKAGDKAHLVQINGEDCDEVVPTDE